MVFNDEFLGKIVPVKIISIQSYGIDIDYLGRVGFIQISELAWDDFDIQNRLLDFGSPGDYLRVKIISETAEKFYASIKQVDSEKNPWNDNNRVLVGDLLQGKVVKVTEYGLWVKLPNTVIALLRMNITIGQYTLGDKVIVIVNEVNTCARKIFVSLKGEKQNGLY